MMCCGANNIVGSGAIQSQSKKLYFAALDGWRFWAALIIVLHHSIRNRYFVPTVSEYIFTSYAMNFFFMLSGFCTAASIKDKSWDPCSTLNYYIGRLIRIWPQHFLSLILFLFLISNLRYFSPKIFTANLFLLQGWIPQRSFYYSYNGPSWYLSTLMGLYLMMPLFVRYFKTCFCVSFLLPFLVSFIIPPGRTDFFYILPIGNAFTFLCGMVAYRAVSYIYEAYPDRNNHSGKMFLLWSVLEIAVTVMLVVLTEQVKPLLFPFLSRHFTVACSWWIRYHLSLPLLFVFFVIFSLGKGIVSRLLSTRIALMLGKLSFVIYLWHVFIRIIIERYDLFHSIPKQWRLILYVAITIVLAFPLEYCINSPVIRWLSSFHKKHPLSPSFCRQFAPLALAICAMLLYLGYVIPRPTDYTKFIFSMMKTVCDGTRYSVVKPLSGNTLLIQPGQKPTSVIFQLNRQINNFSCSIYTQFEKSDVIAKFYRDDKPVKTLRVAGKNIIHKISIPCSKKAKQLRIEIDKNGSVSYDRVILQSISLTGYAD